MAAPWLLWLLLQAGAPETDARALQEEARTVRLELEAARSGDFYLVVNLSRCHFVPRAPRSHARDACPSSRSRSGSGRGATRRAALRSRRSSYATLPRPPRLPRSDPETLLPSSRLPRPKRARSRSTASPPLELRFVPTASKGLFTALKNRFGGSSESPTRVVVTIGDEAASRLASLLPDELRVLFSRSEAP